MPYITQEQIDEIQHEMADLIEQLEETTLRLKAAEAEVRDFKARYPELG